LAREEERERQREEEDEKSIERESETVDEITRRLRSECQRVFSETMTWLYGERETDKETEEKSLSLYPISLSPCDAILMMEEVIATLTQSLSLSRSMKPAFASRYQESLSADMRAFVHQYINERETERESKGIDISGLGEIESVKIGVKTLKCWLLKNC
jgi:hypothetical protein